jgi:hypothetical protein
MRLLALCILLTSLTAHVVGQNGKTNPHKSAAQGQDTTCAKNPIPQVVIQSQSNQQPANQQDATRKGVEHSFLPSPEWVTADSTIGILIATTAYAIISFCTLRKIKRQAHEMKRQRAYMRLQWTTMREQAGKMGEQLQAARDNASAAKKSADAAVNTERAWIRAWFERTASTNYTLTVKNEGKTPARIVAWSITVHMSSNINPSFGNPPPETRNILANVWVNAADSQPVRDFEVWRTAGVAQWTESEAVEKSMYFRALVQYVCMIETDPTKPPTIHETEFLSDWHHGNKALMSNHESLRYT